MKVSTYNIIGLMSGSSLDGLDIVHCTFEVSHLPGFSIKDWKITHAETIEFDNKLKESLLNAVHLSGRELCKLDHELGRVFGQMTADFIDKYKLSPEFISSHGHTVFHFPADGFTCQAGHPAEIAAITQLPVIGDFRSTDIALHGQGAPFAPIVDKMLFGEFDVLVNMGGILNITFLQPDKEVLAYDVCPCNQTLNYLASHFNKAYDENGNIASTGKPDVVLLQVLSEWEYFKLSTPKSLDNSQIKTQFHKIIDDHSISVEDKLATITELIAKCLADAINEVMPDSSPRILLTGGGAFNSFLVSKIREYLKSAEIIIPDKTIISYKEGLLLALMGLLRINNVPNVLKSVTGSHADHVAGAVYQGIKYPLHESGR